MPVIALEGMEFFARHGVYEAERENGNTFCVDVWLDLGETPLPTTDDITDAVDYSLIWQVVADAMVPRANLLETLVLRIREGLREQIPGWKKARIRVSKLNPPLAGVVARSCVEETFEAGK